MSGLYASFVDKASGYYDISMRRSRGEKLGRKYQWNKGKKTRNEWPRKMKKRRKVDNEKWEVEWMCWRCDIENKNWIPEGEEI